MNKKNWRYWSDSNSNRMVATKIQVAGKLKVCCGKWGKLSWVFLIEGNLTDEGYKEILEESVLPSINIQQDDISTNYGHQVL
ncbi:hypothetical protein ANN_26611 [Periplaneta americana]|uniref:Uncharacterized protein n=1 Tax=Periplaneta americana TaxID=6978 RepID=A0ABQ8RYU3_PERAM|nr:hypothetical protein ANN_26611 [Periplaneta americana]